MAVLARSAPPLTAAAAGLPAAESPPPTILERSLTAQLAPEPTSQAPAIIIVAQTRKPWSAPERPVVRRAVRPAMLPPNHSATTQLMPWITTAPVLRSAIGLSS